MLLWALDQVSNRSDGTHEPYPSDAAIRIDPHVAHTPELGSRHRRFPSLHPLRGHARQRLEKGQQRRHIERHVEPLGHSRERLVRERQREVDERGFATRVDPWRSLGRQPYLRRYRRPAHLEAGAPNDAFAPLEIYHAYLDRDAPPAKPLQLEMHIRQFDAQRSCHRRADDPGP
jgi:hypothetical protein